MKKKNIRWGLILYDVAILLAVNLLLLWFYRSNEELSAQGVLLHSGISFASVFTARFLGRIYRQVWRYGGIQCYIRLLIVDGLAFAATLAVELLIPVFFRIEQITFARILSVASLNLLLSMTIRMVYRYCFKCGTQDSFLGKFLRLLLRIFAGSDLVHASSDAEQKIKIAIVGAGRVGVNLAEELLGNPAAAYIPRCFVDISREKVGRTIHGLPVLPEDESTLASLRKYGIQEVVFAIPNMEEEARHSVYSTYLDAGYKVKVYDFPAMQNTGKKRYLREFDVEDLLFRKPVTMADEKTDAYYRNKVILITGGGGSIGSELCRQLARMQPRRIIILDIYENGAYDIQQELKMSYGSGLDLQLEIVSITNKNGLKRVFKTHHPQIVIHAAAHKHVPLMERNCIEAVENNVFGTLNLVEICEECGVERFLMVSTDKAVNPTNVMGATKRMCEMIVQSASIGSNVKYSATRFGNVLGSAGSVIPLFKKQIAAGGPVTLTDKRIVRYFMTIPEASQLVLQSGAMAQNGELFVLDMGRPIRILDLAENMIRISGASGIEIIETGLRPGEKLYEELLIKAETLTKTDNKMVFIEKDIPLEKEELYFRLDLLRSACASGEELLVRDVLKQVVPTYKAPEEVNTEAERSKEMRNCRETVFT